MKSHLPLSSPTGIGAAAQLPASKSLSRVDFNIQFTPSVVPSYTKLYQLYPLDSTSNLLQKHHNILLEWHLMSKLSDFFQDLALLPDFLKPVGEYWWCSDGESQDITG